MTVSQATTEPVNNSAKRGELHERRLPIWQGTAESISVENSLYCFQMKKLQVIEPMHSGHHTNYLLSLLPAIDRLIQKGALGRAVVSVTPRHMEMLTNRMTASKSHWPTIEWDPTLPAVSPGPNRQERKTLHRSVLSSVAQHRADGLICTSADYDIVQNALTNVLSPKNFWPRQSVGILHYGYPRIGSRGKEHLKRVAYESAWMASRWKKLLMVNPVIYEDHLARGKAHPNRYDFLPDPVPPVVAMSRDEARGALGLPRDGVLIGCVGMMDRRKALPELLEAFAKGGFAPDVRLLLAGSLDPSYSQLIDSRFSALVRDGRILVIDRDLSDVELRCGYHAVDLHAVLQYRRFNLSANVLKCVAFGKPFVCDNLGFSALIAERFAAGFVCDVSNVESVHQALQSGLCKAIVKDGSLASKRLIDYHSDDNFARVVLANVVGPASGDVLGHAYRWDYAYGTVDSAFAI